MGCTVEHYWEEQTTRLRKRFDLVASDTQIVTWDEDGKRGFISSRIYFHNEDTFLDVFEEVEITDRPHRLKYNYHLEVEGVFKERFDFDPVLPPDIRHHVNRPGGIHAPHKRISLQQAVGKCWGILEDVLKAMEPDRDVEE